MRFNDYRPAPPIKGQQKPWHPETIEDIRGLDIYLLPESFKSSPKFENGGIWEFQSSFAGHPGFIKERMESLFLQYPNVGFTITREGTVEAYVYKTAKSRQHVNKVDAIQTLVRLANQSVEGARYER